MDRLEASVDKAVQAEQRYQRQLDMVNRALNDGIITQQRAAALTDKVGASYQNALAKMNGFTAGTTRGMNSSRQMGMAVQQAGYQVGDFAVQVASGQGVLRPFIQQGTQLVSMFGPWGAVIGAAGAIVGAFAQALWGGKDASDAAADSFEELEKATKALADETAKGNETARQATLIKLEEAEAHKKAADAVIAEAQAKIAARQIEIDATRNTVDISGGVTGQIVSSNLLGNIAEQQATVDKYKAQTDSLGESIDKLRAKLSGLGDESERQVLQNERLIEAAKVSKHEYEVLAKTFELVNGTFAGTEDQARAVAERLIDQRGTLDKLTGSTKEHTKAIAAEENASRRLAAQEALTETARLKSIAARTGDNTAVQAANDLIVRQTKINELTRLYKGDIEKINRELSEWDSTNAYEKQARFWEDVRKKAQEISSDVSDFLVDGFVNAAQGGGSAFKSLWDGVLAGAKRMIAQIASEFLKQKFIMPIVQQFVGGNSSLFGIAGGAGGASGNSGIGGIMSAGSSLGSITSLFGAGSATATGAAQVAGTVGAHAAPYVSGVSAAGGTVAAGGGLTAGLAAVPVWGWIALAGMAVKSMVEGSDRASAKGAVSTLLMPSLDEWQSDPMRSLHNVVNPIGTVAADFGAPEWLSGAFNGVDPLGGFITGLGAPAWLTPGGILSKLMGGQESNRGTSVLIDQAGVVSDPYYNHKEYSKANTDVAKELGATFAEIRQQILDATGGSYSGEARVDVGSRDGIRARIDGVSARVNSGEKALNFLVSTMAKNITGVTNQDYQKILNGGGSAVDIATNIAWIKSLNDLISPVDEFFASLKAVNDNFAEATTRATELGLATSTLSAIETERQKQIANITAAREIGGYENSVSALGQITGYLEAQQLSDSSGLNPLARQALAQQQYDELYAAVQGGDLSKTQDLTQSASNLLGIARNNYGSSAGYTSVEGQVQSGLAALGQTIGSDASIADQISRAVALSAQSNADKLDEVKAEIVRLNQRLAVLVEKVAA